MSKYPVARKGLDFKLYSGKSKAELSLKFPSSIKSKSASFAEIPPVTETCIIVTLTVNTDASVMGWLMGVERRKAKFSFVYTSL